MYEYNSLGFFFNKFSYVLAKRVVPIYCNVTFIVCFWYSKYTEKKCGVLTEPVDAEWLENTVLNDLWN